MSGSTPSRGPLLVGVGVALVLVVAVVAVFLATRPQGDPEPGSDRGTAGSASTASTPGSSGGAAATTTASADRRKDVEVRDCSAPGGPRVTVTNSSDAPSKFLVVVEIVDSGGEKVATAGGVVPVIEVGASADATLEPSVAVPDGATCRVTQVVRTPG